ncbi:MAG: hydrogenase maturation nickel metallochaperone HypA [Desulfobacterales bacterium]|nr:hydrogenase maturation nickel metallochaperone HypA [Desulfobacterales bacterium]
MHEMGIVMEIIEIASASIPLGLVGTPVERINLKIGKFSAVVPESLQFCFEIASRDTRLAGARLHIEHVPVVARCKECDNQWTIEGVAFNCPECDSGSIDVISGRELDIESIVLAEEDTQDAD